MWVVKIGGSLLGAPELKYWLSLIAQYGDGQVLIVPGGGIFANAVRAAEQRTPLSPQASHRLAVLAMDQYAYLLADMEPNLVLAANELEIAESSWQHRGIIWLPSAMVLSDDTIPASWDVTADSLAAWLAIKLDATHLILVKSNDLNGLKKQTTTALVQDCVAQGLLDPAFPNLSAQGTFQTWMLHKSDYAVFNNGINETQLAHCAYRFD